MFLSGSPFCDARLALRRRGGSRRTSGVFLFGVGVAVAVGVFVCDVVVCDGE